MDTIARVYELLQKQDMTLYQLSRRSGISYSTIRATEKRGGQLSVDTIERICEALRISMSEFFDQ